MSYISGNLIQNEQVLCRTRLQGKIFVPVHFPWHFSEFGVTDKGFLIKMGIVGRHTLEALLAKVENIRVAQRLWGRLFGYKTIYATGTG